MVEHPSLRLSVEKRTLLFQVSSAEFAANGFKQASLNRIISRVGMSKSSFYHFFTNKTDLFNQTIDQAVAPILEGQRGFDLDALTAQNLWPTLFQMAGEMVEQVSSSTDLTTIMRMFYRCMDNPEEKTLIAPYMGEFTTWLTALLNRGQDLHVLRDDLPESLLIDVLLAMGMAVDRWILDHWEDFSPETLMQTNKKTIDLFIRLLEPVK